MLSRAAVLRYLPTPRVQVINDELSRRAHSTH